jgi:hypothetical protein
VTLGTSFHHSARFNADPRNEVSPVGGLRKLCRTAGRLLVALGLVQDLSLRAKHLFVAAEPVWATRGERTQLGLSRLGNSISKPRAADILLFFMP